jgi:hypothetical protein
MNEDLKNLLLSGDFKQIERYWLDEYQAGNTEDMLNYQIIRDFLQLRQTETLVKKTRSLAKATWVLVFATILAQILIQYGPNLLKLLSSSS